MDNHPVLQEQAAAASRRLTETDISDTKLKILNSPDVLWQVVGSLSKDRIPSLQGHVAMALVILATMDETGLKTENFRLAVEQPTNLLSMEIKLDTRGWVAFALTRIDPARGNEGKLYSRQAYVHRGIAHLELGRDEQALADFQKVNELEPGNPDNLEKLLIVKERLGDFQGALAVAYNAIEVERTSFGLQERAILKRMMGDLPGATEDLDEAIALDISLGLADDYEIMKHRGYVAFLMENEDEARAYAERSLRVQPASHSDPRHQHSCLGTWITSSNSKQITPEGSQWTHQAFRDLPFNLLQHQDSRFWRVVTSEVR